MNGFSVYPVDLYNRCEEHLLLACETVEDFDWLKENCINGPFQCHAVAFQGERIASFVTYVDPVDGGPEFVVVAAGGYLQGGSLYQAITPFVMEMARAEGCRYLRGHTQRAGVGKLMERAGWHLSEAVYRKEV